MATWPAATRIELNRRWVVEGEADVAPILEEFVKGQGATVEAASTEGLDFRQGSQIITRLLGAWSLNARLPERGRLRWSRTVTGWQVDAHLEESLGIGDLDERSLERYELSMRAWLDGLEVVLLDRFERVKRQQS
ncbi:MAG: hypothetical protein M3N16_06055 [Actinomycetota bacterium]|nr:hypothetical protein [Actinomycetota bacterium]